MTRLLFVALVGLATACGASRGRPLATSGDVPTSTVTLTGPDAPDWVDGQMPELFDEATHLMVVGRGPSLEEAEADARDRMRAEVLGPETARPFLTVPDTLQGFAYSPGTERYVNPEGEGFVRLIAQRVFIVDRLKSWEALMGVGAIADPEPQAFMVSGQPVTDPTAHLDALATTLGYRRASAYVCERRAAVTTSTCTPQSADDIRRAVRTFGEAIALRPLYAGGVPYRTGEGPQASVAVQAVWNAPNQSPRSIAGLPVTFRAPDGEATAETDDSGRAAWFPGLVEASARVAVRVNAEAVLGRDASLWASLPVTEIGFRGLDVNTVRLALMLKESGAGTGGRAGIQRKLERLGVLEPIDLPDNLHTFFSDAGPPDRERLRMLADQANGTIDLVAVGEMHSQFASRMSARSVWHEASGTMTIYDVWSGAKIGPVERTERAAAIGEKAASSKALRALGERLADGVVKLLSEHYRSGAAARR